jgi:hypothetical protein
VSNMASTAPCWKTSRVLMISSGTAVCSVSSSIPSSSCSLHRHSGRSSSSALFPGVVKPASISPRAACVARGTSSSAATSARPAALNGDRRFPPRAPCSVCSRGASHTASSHDPYGLTGCTANSALFSAAVRLRPGFETDRWRRQRLIHRGNRLHVLR